MHFITWLSGFAFGTAIHCFIIHDPESGFLALTYSCFIALASRVLRPGRAAARKSQEETQGHEMGGPT